MSDKPKAAMVEDQLGRIRQIVADHTAQLRTMQKQGGFADSKTLSMRSTRLEDRVAVLERDVKLLLDLSAMQAGFIEEHLLTDHKVPQTSNEASSIWMRKVKRRLREWAELCNLTRKGRSDIAEARRDENRLRPREGAPS